MQNPAIAIVGAGPAGLTAANILHRNGWAVTVFESDAPANNRDQGGTLDLHPDGGQLALEKAGLLDAFLAAARHEDQEERIADDATGALLREEIPEPGTGQRPEIDRLDLRRLLLHPLPSGMLRWDARVEQVIARPQAGHELRLHGEIAGPFDLVISADGAGSLVREALTNVRPSYTGVTFVGLWLSDVDAVMFERATRIAIDCTQMFAEWSGPDGGRAVPEDMDAHGGYRKGAS